MKIYPVNILGMDLERWEHKSSIADFGIGKKWATLYDIHSQEESKGHATELLKAAKKHYRKIGKRLFGSVALNERMRSIYHKLNIKELK